MRERADMQNEMSVLPFPLAGTTRPLLSVIKECSFLSYAHVLKAISDF